MRRFALPSRTALIAATFLAAYFLWFVIDGTRVGWANDDPMNLYMYWKPGLAKVVESNIVFWNGFYRPFGGIFYLPVYALAHMNPAPYRYMMCALLGVNALLVYRLAKHLSGSTRAAWLAALFVCVHGAMPDLVYSTSSIYDVLAVTFSLLATILYTEGRSLLRRAGVLILMIFAINSKEIAATLPAFFLLYELLFHPLKDLRKNAAFSFLALAIAACAMYGKMHGHDPMTVNEAYRPIFTAARWLDANATYTNTILYQDFPPAGVIGIWIVMALITWRSKSRSMAWALAIILLSTVPISFIPKRAAGSLYLPLVAWAIWLAVFLDWLIGYLPTHLLRTIATAVIAIALWCLTSYEFTGKGEGWRAVQETNNRTLKILEDFPYKPPPWKRILFVGSPYTDGYDLVFLSNLVWNDRTLEINDANLERDHGADQSKFDVVIGFKGDRLEVLKQ